MLIALIAPLFLLSVNKLHLIPTLDGGGGGKLTEAEKAKRKTFKAELAEELTTYGGKSFYGNNEIFLSHYDLRETEAGKEIKASLESLLIEPFKNSGYYNALDYRVFGRCPSGLRFSVAKADLNQTLVHGDLYNMVGCSSELTGFFRLNRDAKIVEMKISEKSGYVALETWLEIREEIFVEANPKADEPQGTEESDPQEASDWDY